MRAGAGALKLKEDSAVSSILNLPSLFEMMYLAFWIPAYIKTAVTPADPILPGVIIPGQISHPPIKLGCFVGPHVPSATPGLAPQASTAQKAKRKTKTEPKRAFFTQIGFSFLSCIGIPPRKGFSGNPQTLYFRNVYTFLHHRHASVPAIVYHSLVHLSVSFTCTLSRYC